MRTLLLTITLLLSTQLIEAQKKVLIGCTQEDNLFTSEEFVFKAKDGFQLKGTITLPKKFGSDDKIAILLTPPQKNSRDYGGMLSSLAKSLSSKGIATLRFDNRAFIDTITRDETYTMFDQVADVHAAFEVIQADKRFTKCQIGLIGHSEGGMAATIEISQNKQISFLVVLSACGIKGTDFAFQQTIMPFYYINMPADNRNHIVSNTYKIIQFLGNMDDASSVEKNFREYLSDSCSGMKEDEIEMSVKLWLKPRLLSFLKFDPALYFSKIKCPALIMHGKMDGLSNWETNLGNIEKIFVQNGKSNYQIAALDSLDHSYQLVDFPMPAFISVQRKPGWKPNYSEKTWNRIGEWLSNLPKRNFE